MTKKFFLQSSGSITIEASFSLVIFIFAICSLLTFASISRTESIIQASLNNTAKKLAQYFYVLEKTELSIATEVGNSKKANIGLSSLTEFIKQVAGSRAAGNSEQTSEISEESLLQDFVNAGTGYIDDKTKSFVFAEMLGKNLCESYFKSIQQNSGVDKFLLSLNIVDGFDGLNFMNSSFLKDGKTINFVVDYKISNPFLRYFNRDMSIRQTASTGAWVRNYNETLQTADVGVSKWHLSPLQRGKAFLQEVRANNPASSVKQGVGVDLYENETCYFYFTLNLFSDTYALYNSELEKYNLRTEQLKKQLIQYINKSKINVNSLPATIEMNDGTFLKIGEGNKTVVIKLIVPEEASEFSAELSQIAADIMISEGVRIDWNFQEKFFIEK